MNSSVSTSTPVHAGRNPFRARLPGIGLWALQILLAVEFASVGSLKLASSPGMVALFAAIGAGQWFRYLVGSLEIAAAIGLLLPRLAGPASLGLVLLMAGATLTQLLVDSGGVWVPVATLVFCAVLAWGRRAQTEALARGLRRGLRAEA